MYLYRQILFLTLTPQTEQDMAEAMGGVSSSLKDINHNPNDLLWQLSTFKAGMSNAIRTLIPEAPVARSGIVFLEKGSDSAGLTHIWMRHGPQFARLCKVTSEHQLQQYLYDVMSRGLGIQACSRRTKNCV